VIIFYSKIRVEIASAFIAKIAKSSAFVRFAVLVDRALIAVITQDKLGRSITVVGLEGAARFKGGTVRIE